MVKLTWRGFDSASTAGRARTAPERAGTAARAGAPGGVLARPGVLARRGGVLARPSVLARRGACRGGRACRRGRGRAEAWFLPKVALRSRALVSGPVSSVVYRTTLDSTLPRLCDISF